MPISLQRCPPCLSNSDDLVSITIDGITIPTSASLSKNGFNSKNDSFAKHVLHNSNMDCLMMKQQFSDALEKTPNRTNGMTLET
jgi:hypothetical protein